MHAMTAWRSCPHPCTSKSTECPDCLGNPPLPTAYGHLHLLPFSREELLSHSQSGPGSLRVPTRLFLILVKRRQLRAVCLTSFSLTASSPQRYNPFYQAPSYQPCRLPRGRRLGTVFPSPPMEWGPHQRLLKLHRPMAIAGDGAQRGRAGSWIPTWYWCRHWYHHVCGGKNLKAALQHTFAVPPLSTAVYRWMHQTLSEELKYEHKFSF